MRPRLRLRQQVMLSYVPLLLIPILVIGILTRSAAERGLTLLVTAQGNQQANALAVRFSAYYDKYQSWDGIDAIFNDILAGPLPGVTEGSLPRPQNGMNGSGQGRPPRNPNAPPVVLQPEAAQVILTDPAGVILAANTPEAAGRSLAADTVSRGVVIRSHNKPVGVLVVGAALGVLDQAQKQLLDTVNAALVAAGLISAAVTIAIGLWLSGQISAPIAALTRGVSGLARGEWSEPIDVTSDNELGELTHAFNQMADDLVRQQNLRKQLIADIAHDLRTPLSVMTLEIEGIKAGLQTPEQAAQSLQDEVEWLSHLVNDLHLLSLIDAGQLPIQPEPTDLGVFLESVYRHWRTAAEPQQRDLVFDRVTSLPIVTLDPPRMRQVLGNLINNAIQHTPPNAAITLQAETNAHQVYIRVIDTGQGIPAEALPHLFERFYRVDRSRQRKTTSGSGLGLSIAYQLTALQGGDLSVQSQLGHGTTFTIALPITPPPPKRR